MLDLKTIKEAITSLPSDEFTALRHWLNELDAEIWDREFEEDVKAGRLDELGDKAERDFHEGKCYDL
jgi:hypothetical protein